MPSALTNYNGTVPPDNSIIPSKIATTFGGFFRNKIINGDFQVAQRGTSFSIPGNGAYTLDRWLVSYDGTIGTFAVSQQSHTVGQTDVPDSPEFFMRWNQTAAGSGSTIRRFEHRIEGVRTLATKVAAVSFYAKADSARNVVGALVQGFGSGGSADVSTALGTFGLTTSWQKFTAQVTVPSITGKTVGTGNYLNLRLSLPINTTMTIDISHVQVEESAPTPFEQRANAFEYDLCQRYYQTVRAWVETFTDGDSTIPFKAVMVAAPTISGGGAGFLDNGITTSGAAASQNTGGVENLTLEAEL